MQHLIGKIMQVNHLDWDDLQSVRRCRAQTAAR